ncbi:MAG: PspC domain-containing protein [Actinomycetota bacterium]|jgi:signal transduction histidine kinase/phage shock protein PspC (stress-responsive transcriptional regulator)
MSEDAPLLVARLTRRREGRWMAGVCNGLATALGVPVGALRAVVIVLALGNLPAVALLYALAWAFLPPEGEEDAAAGADASRSAAEPETAAGLRLGGRPADVLDTVAVLAIAAGAVLLLGQFTAWLPAEVVAPALLAIVGAGVAWGWGGRAAAGGGAPGGRERLRPLFVAVGISLVLIGGFATLAAVGDLNSIGRSAAGAAVLLAGAVLLFGPWMARLARSLTEERRQRIRSEERSEMAAHLHDGVLQTLALIQKRAGDDKAVRSLARRQERELRSWLYGGSNGQAGTFFGGSRRPVGGTPPAPPGTVAALLRRELDDVEDHYAVRFDAVLVGDAPLDEAGRALVAAGREAALNAARHAGVDTVDVYLEVEPDRVSLFVRDRGRGFDPGTVPPDRRGLADSISARVKRYGGTAEIRSAPGEGAEIELSMPRAVARSEEKPR